MQQSQLRLGKSEELLQHQSLGGNIQRTLQVTMFLSQSLMGKAAASCRAGMALDLRMPAASPWKDKYRRLRVLMA